MVLDDSEDAEAEWRVLLENGTPALKAQQSHGTARVAPGVQLYYEIYHVHCGTAPASDPPPAAQPPPQQQEGIPGSSDCPVQRILMIMGFAAHGGAWLPLIHQMLRQAGRAGAAAPRCTLEICIFDNRGIGKSSVPPDKKAYTTEVMAADAHQLLTHLRWPTAHVVGFSMGGMIATKLAAAQPRCVASLTLLSATAGGWQILPAPGTAARAVLQGGFFDKTIKGRALMDVKVHFSSATRHTRLGPGLGGGASVGELLVAEYMRSSEEGGRQAPEGEQGHFNACWTHSVTDADVTRITQGGFPVLVLHGVHDILAQLKYGRRLAARLGAQLLLLDGGHFTPRENAAETAHEVLRAALAAAGLRWAPAAAPRRPPAAGGLAGGREQHALLAGRERRRQGGALGGCFGCCT